MPDRFDNFCVSVCYATGQKEEFNVDAETLIREYPFLRDLFQCETAQQFRDKGFREIAWEFNDCRIKIVQSSKL